MISDYFELRFQDCVAISAKYAFVLKNVTSHWDEISFNNLEKGLQSMYLATSQSMVKCNFEMEQYVGREGYIF